MSTEKKQMRAYLSKAQAWQRLSVKKFNADINIETSPNIEANNLCLLVRVYARDEKTHDLKRNEKGELITQTFRINCFEDMGVNDTNMRELEQMLKELNAL